MILLDYTRLWFELIRLARRRFRSAEDYVRFQQFQAGHILQYLAQHGVDWKGALILDLGSGNGGYSTQFARHGARVFALDRNIVPLDNLRDYSFVRADSVALPFAMDSVSNIFCASLIEHVPQPLDLLREIHRVMQPAGFCYLSFPPFFSLNGGHQFKPYHLLGERLALRIAGHNVQSFATANGSWGLYPLTIGRVVRLIQAAGFQVVSMSTRFSPLDFARVPLLGEFLCWHVQFILAKSKPDCKAGPRI